jgi:3-hydroxyacyl-[acyl-carrier-protein] dehydratase
VSGLPSVPFGQDVIERIIPHRPPFLLVDEIVELEPGVRVVGRKAVTEEDWYLAGHFPGRPIMPGVLMVEALAQAGAVGVLSHPDYAGRLALFAGLDDVRFRRMVTPGDVLELDLTVDRLRRALGRGTGQVRVHGAVAVDAVLTFGFADA